jgi:sugar phosphate isomerase/epimerase
MQVFASTTFHGSERTRASDVVAMMQSLPLDGIELGSTHVFETEATLLGIRDIWKRRILTHNFFPASADESLVLNLAAADAALRARSLDHCRSCITMAAKLGAELYTVHPGYLAAPLEAASKKGASYYDFRFSEMRVPHEAAFAAMLESLGVLLDAAENAGIALAIETEGSVTKQGVLLMERPEEYERLFDVLPRIRLNFNLAHTRLSSRVHGFDLGEFIARFGSHFAAVELSHNDGNSDQHAPLVRDSYVLSWIDRLPDVPFIMEFRNAALSDLERSASLIRTARTRQWKRNAAD